MAEAPELLLKTIAASASAMRDALLQDAFPGREEVVTGGLRLVEDVLDHEFHGGSYCRVTSGVRDVWAAATSGMTPEQKDQWAACLLADLIALAPVRLPAFPAPASIRLQQSVEFARILAGLTASTAERNLDNDPFLKDLSLCRLDSFPCVAQVVEKNARLSRNVLLNGLRQEFGVVLSLGLATGFRYAPFFGIHSHTPLLGGVNPKGWDECYLLVADLLEIYPDYAGLVGGSWFYDPELDRVSPRLAYLRERPLSGGAFLLRVGQSASDITNATATSETRRKLYEAGEYQPTGWLMIWPRVQLIRWARAQRREILSNATS